MSRFSVTARSCWLLAFILFAFCGTRAEAQTELRLTATGTIELPPDEAIADLTVQASAPQAAAAQEAVNRLMASALEASHQTKDITATAGSYDVATSSDAQGRVTQYVASQILHLTGPAQDGRPAAAFTDLVGRLQSQGLQLSTLSADLSPDGRQHAQDQAIQQALRRLHAQAALIAGALGEKTGVIKSLTVGEAGPIMPMPGRMMAAMAPSDEPGPVTVAATVSALINLTPVK
jgi:uncharacterized protein